MSQRANSVIFGFDFQENAAIVLMVKNMAEMESIKIEGEEDIEILLNDGTYVLAQAKSVEKSSTDFSNVRGKAKKALKTLSAAAKKLPAKELIYYTNSPDPLHDKASKTMFYGPSNVKYDNLPDSTKQLIGGWLSKIDEPLDPSRLQIQVLPFETDDDEQRYKVVIERISDFIGKMNLSSADGLRERLHEVWLTMLDRNGSKSDDKIRLNKKEVVWPIIVFVTGKGQLERYSKYCTDLDDGEYEEIVNRYGELIKNCTERFEFVVKVITDYGEEHYRGNNAIECFVNDHWNEYVEELGLNTVDEEIRGNLTKIVLYTILRKRYEIDRIKRSVKL